MSGVRINIVVEGQTEETFVKKVLAPILGESNLWVYARPVETKRRGSCFHRGGLTKYEKLKQDLHRWMRQEADSTVWFTTMFDFCDIKYLRDTFPGYEESHTLLDPYRRIEFVERAFSCDIDHPRFIPYIQLHEFESLVLSDMSILESQLGTGEVEFDELRSDLQLLSSPELINNSPDRSPSKRIIAAAPSYTGLKVSLGLTVTQSIGLNKMRLRCPHFDGWLQRLERLSSEY